MMKGYRDPFCPYWMFLGNDDVWCRKKNCNRSDDGEEREKYQANAVNNHGGKLPIIVNVWILFVVPYLVGDHTQLLKDPWKFAMRAETVVERYGFILTYSCSREQKKWNSNDPIGAFHYGCLYNLVWYTFDKVWLLPWFAVSPPLGVETTRGNPLGTPILRAIPLPTELSVQLCCRKSSSISSTLAKRLRDERSFISMSFICLLFAAGPPVGFRLLSSLSHGRLIRSTHGSQFKNTVRTCIGKIMRRLIDRRSISICW